MIHVVRVVITGGAGYIGSMLTAVLLAGDHDVIVVDKLFFGGDALIAFRTHPRFRLEQRDVAGAECDDILAGVDVVFHLAAIVGFPACRDIGKDAAWRYNVEAAERVFDASERAAVGRFILASTYSNYGVARDDRPVDETSPLTPQSLYAETKIAAERLLLERAATSRCAPILPRFTTLFGISPRTRFDLIVNQFVLEALQRRRLVIYEGNYRRSFVHVRDVVRALILLAEAPIDRVRGEVFNVGDDRGNHSKLEIVDMVCAADPGTAVEHRDLTFGGDMRDVAVSCAKIARVLGFRAEIPMQAGIAEVRDAIQGGLIFEPMSPRHRDHSFSVN